MAYWKLKSCPRCHGDVFVDNDDDRNTAENCLQCGARIYIRRKPQKEFLVNEERRELVAAG